MEENKFDRQNETTGEGSGAPNPTPDANVETPAPAARETEGRMQSDPAAQETAQSSMLPIIAGVVALLVLGGLAYYFLGSGGTSLLNGESNGDITMQQEGGENLSFQLDDTVARVNGEELSGSDLAYQMIQVAQQAGVQDLSTVDDETLSTIREQSLNAIVNTELLVQAAENEGLSVSQEEIDAEYASIVEGVGGQEVANERFEVLGITEEDFRANLADDLIILAYVESRGDIAALSVSEEEIQEFYGQVTQGQTEDVPPLEEVRGQIQEQLQFQKEQEVLSTVVEELRAGANIELLIGNNS